MTYTLSEIKNGTGFRPDARFEEVTDTGQVTDEHVVDAIATLLGTSPEWDGAADYLEDIANLIGRVRPHPGDYEPAAYRRDFKAATGREVNPNYDGGE